MRSMSFCRCFPFHFSLSDLRDLNNWRGIMLLDATSKVLSMIFSSRLQLLLKEVGTEEQNGFMGGAAARTASCASDRI
jgi:hypothetical protein